MLGDAIKNLEIADAQIVSAMKNAIDKGEFDKLEALKELLLRNRDAMQRARALRDDSASNAGSPLIHQEVDVVSNSFGKKETGRLIRENWITSNGLSLRHIKNREYKTKKDLAVGIAVANELPKLPDRWWLGLPDEERDYVVLLCRDLRRQLFDFVLPWSFLEPIWKLLTRTKGAVEFHVERRGATISFRTSQGWLPINQYVSKFDGLR